MSSEIRPRPTESMVQTLQVGLICYLFIFFSLVQNYRVTDPQYLAYCGSSSIVSMWKDLGCPRTPRVARSIFYFAILFINN